MNLTPRSLGRAFPALFASLFVFLSCAVAQQVSEPKQSFDLPAGEARPMLKQFAAQAKKEILFDVQNVSGITTNAVKGDLTPQEALDQMLAGTGLLAGRDAKSGAFAIRRETPVESKNVASRPATDRAARQWDTDANGEKILKLDTFEVFGKKTLNMDIQRTRDDVQPYVTFDRETIQTSMATNVEEFIRARLPMATLAKPNNQFNGLGVSNNNSAINLRGLGVDETLVLVDGRRLPSVTSSFGTDWGQGDLNGIPLSAVERIEILPATAGGIYGGSATGGVVNIILKRNYVGGEISISFGAPFDGANHYYEFTGIAGWTSVDGKTKIGANVGYTRSTMLPNSKRSFRTRAVQNGLLYSPKNLETVALPFGTTPNIRSAERGADGRLVSLVLDNGSKLNSTIARIPEGYVGVSSDAGAALLATAGTFNYKIGDDFTSGGRVPLVTESERRSIDVNGRHLVFDRLEAIAEFSYNRSYTPTIVGNSLNSTNTIVLTKDAPNNPFQQAIEISIPTTSLPNGWGRYRNEQTRILAGLTFKATDRLEFQVDYLRSIAKTSSEGQSGIVVTPSGLSALQSGVLDAMKDISRFPLDYSPYLIANYGAPNFVVDPIQITSNDFTLRLGWSTEYRTNRNLSVAGYSEYRPERQEGYYSQATNGSLAFVLGRERKTFANYLEVRGDLLKSLVAQLSVRNDDNRSTSVSPAIVPLATRSDPLPSVTRFKSRNDSVQYLSGLEWNVFKRLSLRGSYSTGVLDPSINSLAPTIVTQSPPVPFLINGLGVDPKRGNTPIGRDANGNFVINSFTTITNGNPSLEPEKSQSVALGSVWQAPNGNGLRISLDYVLTKKRDEIRTLSASQYIQYEDLFPGRVVRASRLAGDPADWAGPVVQVDRSPVNIAESEVEALDVQLTYTRSIPSFGKFVFQAIGSRQMALRSRVLPSTPEINSVGYLNGPIPLRGNLGLEWSSGHWQAGWSMQYNAAWHVYAADALPATKVALVNNQGGDSVSAETFHDVYLRYTIGTRGAKNSTAILLGIQNVFDKIPAFYANGDFNFMDDPRLRRFSLKLTREF